jgi:hypothetical protein
MQPYFAGVPFHAAPTSRQTVSCHSPLCVSLVYQDRAPTNSAQTVCIQTGFCYPSNPYDARRDGPPHLTAQIRGGVSGAVVATVCASVDADYDNGSPLRGTRGSRRGHAGATSRLGKRPNGGWRVSSARPACRSAAFAQGDFRCVLLNSLNRPVELPDVLDLIDNAASQASDVDDPDLTTDRGDTTEVRRPRDGERRLSGSSSRRTLPASARRLFFEFRIQLVP